MKRSISIPVWIVIVFLVFAVVVLPTSYAATQGVSGTPGSEKPGQTADTFKAPLAITPLNFRSAEVHWDYRLGTHPVDLTTLLTVSSDKTFVLTDIIFTPFTTPAGEPWDFKIYEGTTLKTVIYTPSSQIHFNSGIPFAPGSQVIISRPFLGATAPGNVIFGVTITGYEVAAPLSQDYHIYLPSIVH